MLYLEDFLEIVEQLPPELRDRFTELREHDLEIDKYTKENDKEIEKFMSEAVALSSEDRERRFQEIKLKYEKILNIADDKVAIANRMYELVVKFQRKLAQELQKFKLELEVDNPGITEVLENNVRTAEARNRTYRKEMHRKRKARPSSSNMYEEGAVSRSFVKRKATNGVLMPPPLKIPPPPISLKQQSLASAIQADMMRRTQTAPSGLSAPSSSGVQHQQQHQSIKSENRAAWPAAFNAPSLIGATATTLPYPATGQPTGSNIGIHTNFLQKESVKGRQRKLTTKVQEMLKDSMQRQRNLQQQQLQQQRQVTFKTDSEADESDEETDDDDEEEDEQEDRRTWCFCNQESFGAMVACDNPKCPFEWFHYGCVGITQPPKGKWYCPSCAASIKRRMAATAGTSSASYTSTTTPSMNIG